MKKRPGVTILGILLAVGVLGQGCGSGARQVPVADEVVEAEPVQIDEAVVAEKLAAGIRLYQEGAIDEAGAVFNEVLQMAPDHPEALRCRELMLKIRYCTLYPNDTLSGVASYYYGDKDRWSALARANRIEDPKRMQAYQRLRIPWLAGCSAEKDEVGRLRQGLLRGARLQKVVVVPVKRGDSLRSLARRHYRDERFRFFLADYNRLERVESLAEGISISVPLFNGVSAPARAEPENAVVRQAIRAMQGKEYEAACQQLVAVPEGSPSRPEAERLLARCRSEGESYYQQLGERAFEASNPRAACSHWERALAMNPANEQVRRRLEEARDLVNTLDKLSGLPRTSGGQ